MKANDIFFSILSSFCLSWLKGMINPVEFRTPVHWSNSGLHNPICSSFTNVDIEVFHHHHHTQQQLYCLLFQAQRADLSCLVSSSARDGPITHYCIWQRWCASSGWYERKAGIAKYLEASSTSQKHYKWRQMATKSQAKLTTKMPPLLLLLQQWLI